MMSEEIIVKSIELSCSTIYKRSDGILVFRFKPGKQDVTMAEVKAQLNAFLEIQDGLQSPLLVIPNQLQQLDNEQKMYTNANISRFATKMCVLTDSPIPTFIFNIIFYLSPPPIPAKILKTESEAIAWLRKKTGK